MDHVLRPLCLLVLALAFSACTTERTVTTREGSYQFEEGQWGGQAGDDSKEIRKKFGAKFITDKDGNLIPARRDADGKLVADDRKRDLYNQEVDRGSDFGKRDARLGKGDFKKKLARTPEYLERQKAREGNDAAKDADRSSRAADFAENRDGASGRTSRSQGELSFFERLNPFRAESSSSGDQLIDRKPDRIGSRGIQNAAEATPMRNFGETSLGEGGRSGNRSVDEVAKLLNPGSS